MNKTKLLLLTNFHESDISRVLEKSTDLFYYMTVLNFFSWPAVDQGQSSRILDFPKARLYDSLPTNKGANAKHQNQLVPKVINMREQWLRTKWKRCLSSSVGKNNLGHSPKVRGIK